MVRRSSIDVLVARASDFDGRYKRVLVATDFSMAAEHALKTAVELVEDGTAIDVLHCWRVPEPIETYSFPSSSLADYRAELEANANNQGAELLERHRRDGVEISFKAVETPARVGITDRAADYDLIAMGSYGRTGLRRLVIGSVTAGVVRHAPCSVLVVRPPE